jgi:putative membrane protein
VKALIVIPTLFTQKRGLVMSKDLGEILSRFIVSGLAIAATAAILPGISIKHHDVPTFLVLALVVGIVNGLIKPVIKLITLPISFLTLGAFHLVINVALLYLISAIDNNLKIDTFLWGVLGGIILAVVNAVLEFIAKRVTHEAERVGQRA